MFLLKNDSKLFCLRLGDLARAVEQPTPIFVILHDIPLRVQQATNRNAKSDAHLRVRHALFKMG